MSEIVLNIKDGVVKALYKDEIRPLLDSLGAITIVNRASDVVFDPEDNAWFVYELINDQKVKRLPKGFHLRKDAIAYEVDYLQNKYL